MTWRELIFKWSLILSRSLKTEASSKCSSEAAIIRVRSGESRLGLLRHHDPVSLLLSCFFSESPSNCRLIILTSVIASLVWISSSAAAAAVAAHCHQSASFYWTFNLRTFVGCVSLSLLVSLSSTPTDTQTHTPTLPLAHSFSSALNIGYLFFFLSPVVSNIFPH